MYNSSIVSTSAAAKAINNKILRLIILPTENCNFRCTYCYEDFEIGRMSANTVDGLKLLILNRLIDLDSLNISWFGGEPLIAKDIMLDLLNFASEACRVASVAFSSSATTNGFTLTKSLAEKFSHLNLNSYQISLDGEGATHDTTRKLASSKGTFDKIWQNLCSLKASSIPFEITLRIHLTPQNHQSVIRLSEMIRDTLMPDQRFKIFVKAIGNWGGPNKLRIKTLDNASADQIKQKIYNIIYGNSNDSTERKLQNYICYAGSPNSLVVRADGRIAKCTVAFSDDRNTVGVLNPNGSIKFDVEKLSPWFRGLQTLDIETVGCPYKTLPSKVIKIEAVEINED